MKIHILGIAGTMTAPLAVALKKLGNDVTGSDQEKIYPPISELISNIPLNQPLLDIDLVIVGSSYKSFQICRDEFEIIKKRNIPYISATEYIANNLIKKNSILVAGSYGKTTISGILAHVFSDANYFFGGQSTSGQESLHFSNSDWSVVEADESINGLDTQAKFLYYPVKYLILTSINWEHKDSYLTAQDNFEAFKKLVENIPQDGVLIYNPNDIQIEKLLPFCKSITIPYELKHFDSQLIGEHNQQNISAAYTLCKYLGIKFNIEKFYGIKRRLEIVSNNNNILIIDDFAQSSDRVLSALLAVNQNFPNRNIYVYFEPHASFLQNKQSLNGFEKITSLIKQFVLAKIKFSSSSKQRVSASDWQQIIGEKLIYIPLNEGIIKFFQEKLQPNDILVHFSSGGLDGLNTLKTVYNNK